MLTEAVLYVAITNSMGPTQAVKSEPVEQDMMISGVYEHEHDIELDVPPTNQRQLLSRREDIPSAAPIPLHAPTSSFPLTYYPPFTRNPRYPSPDDSTPGATPSPSLPLARPILTKRQEDWKKWYKRHIRNMPPLGDRNARATEAYINAGRKCTRCKDKGLVCAFTKSRVLAYRCDQCRRQDHGRTICRFTSPGPSASRPPRRKERESTVIPESDDAW